MAKIEKMEKFLKEEKPKKEKDLEVGFDIESFEKEEDNDNDNLGFRSEFEPIAKGKEKTLKKEIQITTPGLKKSIKKFEDFKISISVDEVSPKEEDVVMGGLTHDEEECCVSCECNPCECGQEEGCSSCQCNPCECTSDDTEKVVRFEDFLKSII